VGTFHSICAKFLRTYGSEYLSQLTKCPELNDQFTIYDNDDSQRIVKSLLKKIDLGDDEEVTPDSILSAIVLLNKLPLVMWL